MWLQVIAFALFLNIVAAGDPLPDFWPLEGQLTESIQLSEQRVLKEGDRFTLLRIEDGRVLGTFGRQGTQWINLDATNVLVLSTKIQAGEIAKQAPNLVERLYTTLYQSTESGKPQPMRLEELKDKKYFLFYFARGLEANHAAIVGQLSEVYADIRLSVPSLEWIMIQDDGMVFRNADREKIDWPFMALHLSYAYSEALHLGQSMGSTTFVLTGSNGDILRRYDLRRMTVAEVLKDVLTLIEG